MAESKVKVATAEEAEAGDVISTSARTVSDEYDEYNYDQDKYEAGGGSGKGRSKKEVEQHTNHHDPGGHTRKTTQKLINSHEKEKEHHKEQDKEHGKEQDKGSK